MNDTQKKALEKGMEDATFVDFKCKSGEVWSTYSLNDGSTLKIKTLLKGVARLSGQRDNFGRPVYYVETQNIVTLVSCPKKLIKKPQKPGVS